MIAENALGEGILLDCISQISLPTRRRVVSALSWSLVLSVMVLPFVATTLAAHLSRALSGVKESGWRMSVRLPYLLIPVGFPKVGAHLARSGQRF